MYANKGQISLEKQHNTDIHKEKLIHSIFYNKDRIFKYGIKYTAIKQEMIKIFHNYQKVRVNIYKYETKGKNGNSAK